MTHYGITMGNNVARNIQYVFTVSNHAMCIFQDIIMHNDIAMNLLFCITTHNYDIAVSPVHALNF